MNADSPRWCGICARWGERHTHFNKPSLFPDTGREADDKMSDAVSKADLPEGAPTELGWMLSCSGVHPEAVKIVEALQEEARQLEQRCAEAERLLRAAYVDGNVFRVRADVLRWLNPGAPSEDTP